MPISGRAERSARRSGEGGTAVFYVPVGDGTGPGGAEEGLHCPTAADAAVVNVSQMAFLIIVLNVLSLTANVANNINNNNNNNNRNSINALSNSNVASNTNVNAGNEVNVMVPMINPGK